MFLKGESDGLLEVEKGRSERWGVSHVLCAKRRGGGAPTGQLATGWLTNIHTPSSAWTLSFAFSFAPLFFIVNKNKIICFLLFRQRCKWQNNNPQPITLVLRTGGPKFCSFYKKILNYWISLRRNSFILWNKWVDFSPRYTCAIFKLWYKII